MARHFKAATVAAERSSESRRAVLEKVLHNFGLGTDGCYPLAALVNVGGRVRVYGTTYSGGMYGVGTAFLASRLAA